jgi:hypothetical protein
MNVFSLFASGGGDASRAESDLSDRSGVAYGYRPRRTAVDAVKEAHRLICRGYTDVPLYSCRGQPAVYAYSDNCFVDLKHAVILDVEATMAIRQAEVSAAKTMLDRTG